MTPEEALRRLLEGNERYASENSFHPNRDQERRSATAKEQNPFAVILGCSDSRVPAEVLFDVGIGDLFVVRVAGNVLGPVELASIRFAIEVLNVPFLLVLGHENCGAIQAVLSGKTELIAPIADLIQIGEARSVEEAVKNNIRHIVQDLSCRVDISVKGCYYSFLEGRVQIL